VACPSRSLQNGGSLCRTPHHPFIRIASTSEAKTTVSNSTQCEPFIGDGKKYTVFGVTFSFKNIIFDNV